MHANHVSILIRCAKILVNGALLSFSECAVYKFSVVPQQRDKSEFEGVRWWGNFASVSERNSKPRNAGRRTLGRGGAAKPRNPC